MNDQTYTATGFLDLENHLISLDIAIPNPPLRNKFITTYYNLSKRSASNGVLMNVILCEFTFEEDPGNPLAPETTDRYETTLEYNSLPKPKGMPDVVDFDFDERDECLFLFFHSTAADEYDRQTFFDDMEELYSGALPAPYVIYPAPLMKTAPPPTGRPRVLSPSIIRR